jgi:hypothetical protein
MSRNLGVSCRPEWKNRDREESEINTKHRNGAILENGIGKVKAKLSLGLSKHHAMKTYWGSEGIAPRIL